MPTAEKGQQHIEIRNIYIFVVIYIYSVKLCARLEPCAELETKLMF